MCKIYINLTQHQTTPEQVDAGVVDLSPEQRQQLARLLTLDALPDHLELRSRSRAIGDLVAGLVAEIGTSDGFTPFFLIGGAPFLVSVLAEYLSERFSTDCVYAFSKRVSQEDPVTGVKTSVFKHEGFVKHYSSRV